MSTDSFTLMNQAVDRAIETMKKMADEIDTLRKQVKLEYSRGFAEGFRAANDHHDKSMALIEGALSNR